MTRLVNQFSTEYVRARNALNQRTGSVVEIFVENEDDVPFWFHVFRQFDIPIRIYPASKDSLARGKEIVLKHLDRAGEFLLLCVDSDYDYLLGETTERSKQLNNNPFIFQTYTYSIENYKCFPEGLYQVVVETSLQDQQVFDFYDFIKRYSNIIYELFLYSFYYERQYKQENETYQKQKVLKKNELNEDEFLAWEHAQVVPEHLFKISDFSKSIKIPQIDISSIYKVELNTLREVVNEKLQSVRELYTIPLDTLNGELTELGVTPDNTYLFAQGHAVYNSILLVLEKVSAHLKKEKFTEIKNQAQHEEERITKVNEYKKYVVEDYTTETSEMSSKGNSLSPVARVLFSHKNYESCLLMQKIKADIEKYYENYWKDKENTTYP